jgi:hypothetical protein
LIAGVNADGGHRHQQRVRLGVDRVLDQHRLPGRVTVRGVRVLHVALGGRRVGALADDVEEGVTDRGVGDHRELQLRPGVPGRLLAL